MGCDKILGVASIGVAAVFLALVAFDVPYFKSIYFLRIDLSGSVATTVTANQTTPFVDLGVLGFCTDLQNGLGLQCSPAKIGYSLSEASHFIDGTLPAVLSNGVNVAAAALTKALVLHLVALAVALGAFAFALLALLGIPFLAECCADCFSGVAVLIFDVAFFFVIRKRVDAETGAGSAVAGNAVWLTGAATLLLVVTPIMFLIGRCCGVARKLAPV
ncbi:hypothetical protein MSAN_00771800 [Mycena sanguinolenta]|uniref:Pali-domain-containing protein n=1 Tax=Mycena sanguinolenta TaxID=230812 RepID=A0A8H6Z5S3_9AGAR|nr:hypothetical protein MSAN_00771800 [Mycena sanguinolenta]